MVDEQKKVEQKDPSKKEVKPRLKKALKSKADRIPLRKQKRIGITRDPGYHYRLVTDKGERISAFMKGGYELVEGRAREGEKASQDASQLGKYASQQVGGGDMAYYMRIPEDLYKRDQKEKQDDVTSVDEAIGMDKVDPRIRRGSVDVGYGPLDIK